MANADELLGPVLRDVSRSFYLTLRIIPRPVRRQIGLAYLLARTTDTIADTELVPPELRIEKLRQFRERIRYADALPVEFEELIHHQENHAERVILERSHESLGLLDEISPVDRGQIQFVLETITRGQELDLKRFGDGQQLRALETRAELDDYTYRVAGCVGEFWTRMTRTHCFPDTDLNEDSFLSDAVRFGKGLQLVNVLRDIPRDLSNGRCYIPAEELSEVGLQPEDLLEADSWGKLEPLFSTWLTKARAHLTAGWRYTNTIPFNQYRLRLACAWPILIGLVTLEKMRGTNPLQGKMRVKASRSEVRSIIWRSTWRLPFRRTWGKLFTSI